MKVNKMKGLENKVRIDKFSLSLKNHYILKSKPLTIIIKYILTISASDLVNGSTFISSVTSYACIAFQICQC
jgi:hypothetical protein